MVFSVDKALENILQGRPECHAYVWLLQASQGQWKTALNIAKKVEGADGAPFAPHNPEDAATFLEKVIHFAGF